MLKKPYDQGAECKFQGQKGWCGDCQQLGGKLADSTTRECCFFLELAQSVLLTVSKWQREVNRISFLLLLDILGSLLIFKRFVSCCLQSRLTSDTKIIKDNKHEGSWDQNTVTNFLASGKEFPFYSLPQPAARNIQFLQQVTEPELHHRI